MAPVEGRNVRSMFLTSCLAVIFGLKDLHSLSPANFVFGGSVRLPGEFFAPETDAPTPTHDYISNFSKHIANLTYHQPRATHRNSQPLF